MGTMITTAHVVEYLADTAKMEKEDPDRSFLALSGVAPITVPSSNTRPLVKLVSPEMLVMDYVLWPTADVQLANHEVRPDDIGQMCIWPDEEDPHESIALVNLHELEPGSSIKLKAPDGVLHQFTYQQSNIWFHDQL